MNKLTKVLKSKVSKTLGLGGKAWMTQAGQDVLKEFMGINSYKGLN